MSITFPRKFAIGGVPVTNIKEGLKSLSRTNDPGSFVGLRSVFPTLIHGSHALEIAGLLGLLDDERSDLTPTGRAVAHSRSVVKTELTKARGILDQLLERFVAINADPDRLISINRVYLYGSVMRGDPLVGDIDLDIEASRGPAYANDLQGYLRDCLAFVRRFAPNYVPPVYMAESDKAMDYLAFGQRRAPILTGAMINVRNLSTIPAPCQLIYTIQNGIDLNAPILTTHPDYDPAIETSHEIPHLASIEVPKFGTPEPVDARFISKFQRAGRVVAHDFASPTSNQLAWLLRLHEQQSSTLKVHVRGDTLDPTFAKRSGLADDLSPKGTIVLTTESQRSELRSFMKIERRVTMTDGTLTIELKVSDLATLQRRRTDEAHAACLAVVAATIHMADRFHAIALNQAGNNYPIEATVTTASSVPDTIGPLIQQFGSKISESLDP
ncbi:hypothetical protein [Blastomonas fulva]|uniref:Nucleotidyltransferase n=1 Tax=Blastomonas fulva TaxID=1550728 RepID=A0ABM6MCB9_9SPHN|nr:hypothetical protein [Blastomonas fulva]ASR53673.1 hypothetical protein B5J99_18735 [Blastomonas fulva]